MSEKEGTPLIQQCNRVERLLSEARLRFDSWGRAHGIFF